MESQTNDFHRNISTAAAAAALSQPSSTQVDILQSATDNHSSISLAAPINYTTLSTLAVGSSWSQSSFIDSYDLAAYYTNYTTPTDTDDGLLLVRHHGNLSAATNATTVAAANGRTSIVAGGGGGGVDGGSGDHHLLPLLHPNNYWALLALVLVFGTAAGNILVCLAIAWERRLQNVTNYFLMSLAITDLMVAMLVMPLGILTLVKGHFPLQSEHCLAWICLDVLFCTASIMHLCTISIDRYLSLRYPMRFGRNKTRKRVTVKIIFVWLLSIAMSLPLSLMYSKNHASVLVNGTCQIPDPVYKLVGSIVCFYIPLGVMLITYCLTVRLLARQRQNLGGNQQSNGGWASGWLGQAPSLERRCTWRRLLKTSLPSTPSHAHSATSTDTELSNLDTHELWLPESSLHEPTPSTMTALHQFGAEMLKLSRGLESVTAVPSLPPLVAPPPKPCIATIEHQLSVSSSDANANGKLRKRRASLSPWPIAKQRTSSLLPEPPKFRKRFNSLPRDILSNRDSADHDSFTEDDRDDEQPVSAELVTTNHTLMKPIHRHANNNNHHHKKGSFDLPPPCTCPYFGETQHGVAHTIKPANVKIITTSRSFLSHLSVVDSEPATSLNVVSPLGATTPVTPLNTASSLSTTSTTTTTSSSPSKSSLNIVPMTGGSSAGRKLSYSKTNSVVTWDTKRSQRRGSSFGGARTSLLLTPTKSQQMSVSPLRRSATLRNHNNIMNCENNLLNAKTIKAPSTPCLLQRSTTIRPHHSRNSSVISRNSSRHGRIIRLEQKATKVLGVVFFTFVILWAPFFVLNLLPSVCQSCEENMSHWVFDVVTWLGYASSMVNPIFYTIFNKVFRQAFKKVLLCQYSKSSKWRPQR